MRLSVKLILLISIHLIITTTLRSQNCIPTNINGTAINLACNQVCSDLVFPIPHIKSSDNYTLVSVPYKPYPYTSATGVEDAALYADDEYSFLISLPFPFCFYGSNYNSTVVGSNGIMTFDPANANCANSWPITQPIPYAGGSPCLPGTTYYPRASIMGAYSDLDPRTVSSPADRKISWFTEGTAPCRKFIVSFYHIGVFGGGCGLTTPNTFQMVIHESTGLVEVFFERKACSSSTNGGRAILGIQNWNQNAAIPAPGKNNTVWNETTSGYRFIPSSGTSRYLISELLTMAGTVVATADTITTTPGILDVRFLNFCAPSGSNQYVVRTTFSSCDNSGTQLISLDTITINRTSSLNATATTTNTSCGPPNGTITVAVPSGIGTSPYTFILDGGVPVTGLSPFTFTGVAQGPHVIQVIDASGGCNNLINTNVNISTLLTATTTSAATSCPAVNNGSITITSVSGTGPYSFLLDGGASQTGPLPFTFSNLPAGNHTIIVTDQSNGCVTNMININIVAGTGLSATAIPIAASCSGASNGSIMVTPVNGTGPYNYSLDGAAPVSGPSPFTFNNVPTGIHTVIVTDGFGCTTNPVNVIVSAGPVLVTTAFKTDVLCYGGLTGTITVNQPASGTPPYSYSLNRVTWQGSPIFTGLAAGIYSVYYRESNGCENSLSITISEPAILSATVSTVAAICNGESNGTITVTPAGGVPPYEYSINAGVSWQNSNIFNAAAGNYSVTIRDVNGCTARQLITVTEPAILTAASTNTNASCNGGNDGTITIVANGGNSNYMYSIDGTNFQTSNKFNVDPGSYTITVKDNLGCIKSFDATVLLTNNLTFTPQTDRVICESFSTQLQINSNATVFAWTPATGLSNASIINPVANPLVTTEYYVTATLGRCSIIDTVVVNVNKAPVPNAGSDGFICYGQSYQLNATGGTQYKWTPSTFLDNPNQPNPVSTPTNNIKYTLSIISDLNGCSSLITDDIAIDVTQPIKVKTYPYDTIGYSGDQFQLNAVPSDSDAIIYSWTPARGLNFSNIANPKVTIGAIGEDVLYQVITSTIAGCKGEGYVRVRVFKGPDIYVPNAFTPNGDGRNDKFFPFPVGIKSLNYFRVYNRWGQMVFSTNKLNEGWDGNLGGLKQGNATFVWMAEAITKDNKIITKKGTVTLIR